LSTWYTKFTTFWLIANDSIGFSEDTSKRLGATTIAKTMTHQHADLKEWREETLKEQT
jgi:hypothetical protein